LLSLSSEFQTAEDLARAEKMIWSNIETAASLYRERV